MIQLSLLETPAPSIYRSREELKNDRSRDPAIVADMLAVFAAKPGEWIDAWAFRNVVKKHDVSGFIGPILRRLRDSGAIEEKNVYFGDERPGGKNYLGFVSHYKLAEGVTA